MQITTENEGWIVVARLLCAVAATVLVGVETGSVMLGFATLCAILAVVD